MPLPTSTDANISGDLLWAQSILGKDGANTILAAEIRAYADANAATGKIATRFEFWTTTTGGTLTKALTIDSAQLATFAGNVGLPNVTATGLFKLSGIETGLTAHAGGTQAAALALSTTKSIHNVTTVGTAADSVALPLATGSGAVHWVKNSAAANSLQLFGSGTDTIDGVLTTTGVAIAAGKSRICLDFAAGTWLSILGA
jgi:hypothetical protein